MSTLLEKALEQVVTLPQDEQDAIAAQILLTLADDELGRCYRLVMAMADVKKDITDSDLLCLARDARDEIGNAANLARCGGE